MSVVKSKRGTSNIEFLKVLRDIESEMLRIEVSKPSKYKYIIHDCLMSQSAKAYSCAKSGNSIYVTDDEGRKNQLILIREKYMMTALVCVQSIASQVEVLRSAFKSEIITDNELKKLSELLSDAYRLINGVIKADRKRYKM